MSDARISIAQLRGPILQSVSRSFYLSIRFLPRPLRDPIALAYLLARATDTIADTEEIDVRLRQSQLHNLAAAIQGNPQRAELLSSLQSFVSLQRKEAERQLILALPACLEWLETLEPNDRSEVEKVLQKINRGQSLDLQRSALATEGELDEYTYLVAGCVGEFWTRICFLHLKNFCRRSEQEMTELGVEYGKGLQLINILRDAGADLRAGRCYLPLEDLHSLGLTPEDVLRMPECVEPLTEKWRARAGRGIAQGLEYACAIRNVRVRFATALPALIGARTLALLRAAGGIALQQRVKVSRVEIRNILSTTAMTFASSPSLHRTFARLSR